MSKAKQSRARASSKSAARRPSLPNVAASSKFYYAALLGLKVRETSELIERIKEGLAYSSWEDFLHNTTLQKQDAAWLVQLTPRTLSRRKVEGRLHPDESDRLLRAARVFAQALELFEGDAEAARRWLTSSQPALGGANPIEYAATDVGGREVEALIGRIEHGIPS
jgi:putative toxin-antitoxin system antitoxin component (TIGR02293 family)